MLVNLQLLVYYERLLKQVGFVPRKVALTYLTMRRLFLLAFVRHILQTHMSRIARVAKLQPNMEW